MVCALCLDGFYRGIPAAQRPSKPIHHLAFDISGAYEKGVRSNFSVSVRRTPWFRRGCDGVITLDSARTTYDQRNPDLLEVRDPSASSYKVATRAGWPTCRSQSDAANRAAKPADPTVVNGC